MEDLQILTAEEERLLAVAMDIADGTPVNWADHEPESVALAGPTPVGSAALAPGLRVLEKIVRGHQEVNAALPLEPHSQTGETLLSEARRMTPSCAGDLLRVEWGPLIVHEKIGHGSFGDVYRAWDPRLQREVALKLVNATSPEVTTAFEEGRRLARVRHPNVVTVFGAERIENRVGIWMEYVRGRTLAEEIVVDGAISASDAARIGVEVCRALSAVHNAGLLHRDVKAQNVMRDAQGRIVLGDFGTGLDIDERLDVVSQRIAGTPLYLAPEILDGHPPSAASDVYSVGVLLYFLVTGKYPTRGLTLTELRQAHLSRQQHALQEERPELPSEFVEIVAALIEPGPDRKYGTADSAEVALTKWLNTTAAANTGATPRPRQWKLLISAALFVTIIAAAGMIPSVRATIRSWTGGSFSTSGAPISRQIIDPPCTGRPSTDGRWIACIESPSHVQQRGGTQPAPIVLFNPWTGEVRNLREFASGERGSSAVISPDGSKVAFTMMAPKQSVAVRVLDTRDRAERLLLSVPPEVVNIALNEWAAHDQQIVARIWRRDQTQAAATLSIEAGSLTTIAEFEGPAQGFSRSADGRMLAFDTLQAAGSAERDIRVCDLAAHACQTVAGHPAIDVLPIWAPDGRLLFNSDRAGTMGLWAVALEGPRQKSAPELIQDTGRGRMSVAGFGPDGLLFYTLTHGDFDVYSASLEPLPAADITPVRLSPRAVDLNRSPVWSHDGASLAYMSRRGPFAERGAMRVVVQSVADGREREFRFDVPPNLNRLAWSPDDRLLALRSLMDGAPGKGIFGIHLIDADSGQVVKRLTRHNPVQKDIEDQISDIAWIDQRTMLFAHSLGLGAFDVDSGSERAVWSVPAGATLHGMSLAADSLTAAVTTSEGPPASFTAFSVTTIPTAGGTPREVLRVKAPEVLWMQTWTNDGQSVLVTRWDSAQPFALRRPQLWKLPIDGSTAVALPLALPGLSEVRLHPDGRRAAFTAGGSQTDFWMMTVK